MKPSSLSTLVWDPYNANCPTRNVLNHISDKWVVLILARLCNEPVRFNALLREIQGISQKVLSQTLKRLERDGLVNRTAFLTVPVTVEYRVTPLGATLAGALCGVIDWAKQNIDAVAQAQQKFDGETAG